jgi:putative glutamine amidotransferase
MVLSGGDDPATERWGQPTHPRAKPMDPRRQAFEVALLEALDAEGEVPVLGICLGMQLMGLHRGGRLDQFLPESLPTAEGHAPGRRHAVSGALGCGPVHSHHRQALADPGALSVVARAEDGLIEAVRDEARPFYVGVQWHPERTEDEALGPGLFRSLVDAARARMQGRR